MGASWLRGDLRRMEEWKLLLQQQCLSCLAGAEGYVRAEEGAYENERIVEGHGAQPTLCAPKPCATENTWVSLWVKQGWLQERGPHIWAYNTQGNYVLFPSPPPSHRGQEAIIHLTARHMGPEVLGQLARSWGHPGAGVAWRLASGSRAQQQERSLLSAYSQEKVEQEAQECLPRRKSSYTFPFHFWNWANFQIQVTCVDHQLAFITGIAILDSQNNLRIKSFIFIMVGKTRWNHLNYPNPFGQKRTHK